MKIKDIAAACGFDDSKSFQKFFKYHEGMTAAAYRELYFGSKRSASKVSRKATEKWYRQVRGQVVFHFLLYFIAVLPTGQLGLN